MAAFHGRTQQRGLEEFSRPPQGEEPLACQLGEVITDEGLMFHAEPQKLS